MRSSSVLLAVIFILPISPAFAQEIQPAANLTEAEDRGFTLDSGTEVPMLEALSENGTYIVILIWNEDTLDPQGAIPVEILFLNASAPASTSKNIPQTETNKTGASSIGASGFNDPSILKALVPVESYDMIVYSGGGKELWKVTERPVAGGSATERIILGNYTGPVTIEINNIKPGWIEEGTTTASDMTDSVTFTATVVPEFPLFLLPLAMGIGAIIAAMRLHRFRRSMITS